MHNLSHVTLLSMSLDRCSCSDRGRVLPTSVGVAVFLRILATRAPVACIHSLCLGVNGDMFVVSGECEEDEAGNCDDEGTGEDGHGVEAVEDGSGMVATHMMSPD